MPTTVKTGWLQDKNGDKFAPKTLTSQVQTSDGILIEDKIQADLGALQKTLDGKANASHTHDYIPNSLKGAANGLAELDSSGKVLSSQLPSYVDDVIEGYLYNSKFYKESAHTTVITGETGKIYIDLSSSKTYRWSGSAFAEISASLALGETSSTAYRGDRGKTAYDHSQAAHAPADAEKNQNAFSNIKIGSTSVAADTTTDTLELVGSNVTLTPDATNDKVTIGITKANVTAALGYTPPTTDNNTTYDLAASASSANGNVKLNLKAGGSGSGTDSVSIKGGGATTVTTDANGVITISSVEQKPVYVTLTLEMGGYSSDLTYSQIKSAHDAGSSIYCKVIGTSDYGISYGDFCLPLTRLGLGDNSFIFQGTFEARDEEAYNVTKGITVTINSVSNNVEFSTISHPQIYDLIEEKTEVKMKIWTTNDMGGT